MKENAMTESVQKQDAVVLMYPTNQLKEQERDFSDTLSAFQVIKKAFVADA